MGLHGALADKTASLATFASLSALLVRPRPALLQEGTRWRGRLRTKIRLRPGLALTHKHREQVAAEITLGTLTLVMAGEFAAAAAAVCGAGQLPSSDGCADPTAPGAGMLGPLLASVGAVGGGSAGGGVGAWTELVGCAADAGARDALLCVSAQLDRLKLAVAVLMFVPMLFQLAGALLAGRLRLWIIEERGVDLFTMCRISQV